MAGSPFSSGHVTPKKFSAQLIGTKKRPWLGSQSSQDDEPPQQAGMAPKTTKDVDPNDPDYEGPEDGPFECDNCQFFSDPNQCAQPDIVRSQGGQVDPKGCCKFFNSLSGGNGGQQQQG